MPSRKRHPRYGGLLVLACALQHAPAGHAQDVASAVYVRTDSDHTLVVAPRLHARLPIEETTNLNFVYAVDVWTSASIDIMTSASKLPVTEQRDEIDLSVDHDFDDVTLSGSYRYSTEPDYVSHGGALGLSYDFADNNSTLGAGLSGSSDSVGKAGDPEFDRAVGTLGARLSFTQVLGRGTIATAIYELSRTSGYLASPYRYVAIGSMLRCTAPTLVITTPAPATPGTPPVGAPAPVATTPPPGASAGLGQLCVPEAAPGKRLRHAAALELRQAIGGETSIGAGYRFYVDDWSLSSHTLNADLSWAPGDTVLSARYRFYTQGHAEQYRPFYLQPQAFVTTDKELSPLTSHRIALELDHDFEFRDSSLRLILSFAPIFYSFSDFIPVSSITAYEFNAALVYTP